MAQKNKMKLWRKMAAGVNSSTGEKHQGRKFKSMFVNMPAQTSELVSNLFIAAGLMPKPAPEVLEEKIIEPDVVDAELVTT